MPVFSHSRILDLGCGWWDDATRSTGHGTPHFYLAQQPEFYLGIDARAEDIARLEQELGPHFLEATVDSPGQLALWLTFQKITHLKSDIEGAEKHLAEITHLLSHLQAVAIETHGHDVHRKICDWILWQGLQIHRIDQQSDKADIHIVYARRPAC